jgi:hypothetical protein
MAATIAEVRGIQVSVATREPAMVRQGGAAISAPNGAPSTASAGVGVADATGNSAVTSMLAIVKDSGVTAYTVQWWGYVASGSLTAWVTLGAGSLLTDLDKSWGDIVPTGPLVRVYCELVAISGTGGISPYVGPAGV